TPGQDRVERRIARRAVDQTYVEYIADADAIDGGGRRSRRRSSRARRRRRCARIITRVERRGLLVLRRRRNQADGRRFTHGCCAIVCFWRRVGRRICLRFLVGVGRGGGYWSRCRLALRFNFRIALWINFGIVLWVGC